MFKKITINKGLLISLILFMFISCFSIYSSMIYLPSYLGNLALKQFIYYIIGFIVIIILLKIDINKYIVPFYIINLLLLLFLLIFGQPINGSKCWFNILGISFQPSEFMKIAIILLSSKIISNSKSDLKLLITLFIVFIPSIILTFLEPDTGAVIIYLIIIFSMLIISPINKKWFILFICISLLLIISFIIIYLFYQDLFIKIFGQDLFYRINRLLDWKNGTGMQLENSVVAIGSSGILGHGYRNTPIYFPESGTDFIFSVYASNFGLFGCFLLFSLILYFNKTLIDISINTKDNYHKYIIIGSLGMFLYQQIQNISMTVGLLPITGITLPFISYGGSSLIAYMIIIGIIFKISSKRTIN